MFCTKCGKKNKDGVKFCIYCGAPLGKHTEQSGTKTAPEIQRTPAAGNKSNNSAGNRKTVIVILSVIIVILVIFTAVLCALYFGGRKPDEAGLSKEVTTEGAFTETTAETTTEAAAEPETINDEGSDSAYTDDVYSDYDTGYEDSMSDLYDRADEMLSQFYTYAWFNTTNSHDSSYVYEYTVPHSSAYQQMGVDYWQQNPDVRFSSVHDVNLVSLEVREDGSYDAYVSYVFEVYHKNTGKTASGLELAIDNLVLEDGQFLMQKHTWKNDLSVGTPVDISDFK